MPDDYWEGWRADVKARRTQRDLENRQALVASGVPFTDRGTALLFRVRGKPPVDFYPTTGRWRVPSRARVWSGGATAFLRWYQGQTTDQPQAPA
jgi:hypothetical protein